MRYIVAFLLALYFAPVVIVLADPLSVWHWNKNHSVKDWVELFAWPITAISKDGDKRE